MVFNLFETADLKGSDDLFETDDLRNHLNINQYYPKIHSEKTIAFGVKKMPSPMI